MANQFSKMYDVEIVGGDQRQRLAEMLRANALNAPQGQMVSGWYVPPSWTQNLAQLANTAVGVFGGQALDKEQKEQIAELIRKRKQGVELPQEPVVQNFNRLDQAEGQTPFATQPALTEFQRITGRQPIQAEGQSQANPQMLQRQAAQPAYRPMTQEELDENMMQMYQVDPRRAAFLSGMERDRAAAEQTKALKEEERAWRTRENELNRQNQQLGWMMARGNRPERMLTVMDETGSPVTIPQSQMQPGMTIYNPTTAKAFKERQSQEEGKNLAADQIQNLRAQYDILNQNYGITSEQNRIGSNVGAYLSGTGVGHALGRIVGSKNATARDVIRMSRPALMQTLVKASGISAKQIDSNAEAKMMLDQATDPDAGYEANQTALDYLENRFIGKKSAAPSGMPSQSAIDAEIAARKQRGQGR